MTESLSPRILLIESPEDAAREMRRIGVSDGGIDAMTGKARTVIIKVTGVAVPVAHILKEQMLSIGGDAAVAGGVLTHSVQATDVLIMGTRNQVMELVRKLSWQPFDLPGLGERIASMITALDATSEGVLRARGHSLDLRDHVHIMGILNLTPDSFSDGGAYLRPSAALDRALEMVAEGADIIDVGGMSSRPGSTEISENEEIARTAPAVARLHEEWDGPISIDTYRAAVAKEALEAGASIVNDITAFGVQEETAVVTAEAGAACVLMHMQGTPETMQDEPRYDDLMGEIAHFLQQAIRRATDAGIGDDQIVIDPGIGFGKTTKHNLEILKRLPELKVLGKPILVGPSRKAFIGKILDLPVGDRLEGTLAAAAHAVARGARLLRVHDVRPVVRTARMIEACLSQES